MCKLFIVDHTQTADAEIKHIMDSSFISGERAEELHMLSRNADSMHFRSSFLQAISAELMIAAAMRSEDLPYAPPEYYRMERGKPMADNRFFSVSHTKGYACCIICSKPIGIDMEVNRSVKPEIARKLLSDAELVSYAASKDRNRFLLRHWVAKESYLKLTGDGLAGGLRHLYFDENNSSIEAGEGRCKVRLIRFDGGRWHMHCNDDDSFDLLISVSGTDNDLIRVKFFKDLASVMKFLEN